MKVKHQVTLSRSVRQTKNLSFSILNTLAAIVDVAEEMVVTKKDIYHALHKLFGNDWSESKCSKYLYDLKRNGYLSYSSHATSVKFTDKAKIKTLETLVSRLEVDSKKRFISFDIPEEKKGKREQFRKALKDLGCHKIQGSLWVTNRNIGQFVEMAAYTFGIEQYVVYIISEKTNIDGIIDKKFAVA